MLCSFGLEASEVVEEEGFLVDEDVVEDEEVADGFLAVDEDRVEEVVGFRVNEGEDGAAAEEETFLVVEDDLAVDVDLVVDVDLAVDEDLTATEDDLATGALVVDVDLAAEGVLVVDVDLATDGVLVVEVDLAVEEVLVVEVDLAAEVEVALVVEVDLAVEDVLVDEEDLAAEEEVADVEEDTFLVEEDCVPEGFLVEEEEEMEEAGFLAEEGDAAGFLADEERVDVDVLDAGFALSLSPGLASLEAEEEKEVFFFALFSAGRLLGFLVFLVCLGRGVWGGLSGGL